jgi:hypothetical protein
MRMSEIGSGGAENGDWAPSPVISRNKPVLHAAAAPRFDRVLRWRVLENRERGFATED